MATFKNEHQVTKKYYHDHAKENQSFIHNACVFFFFHIWLYNNDSTLWSN